MRKVVLICRADLRCLPHGAPVPSDAPPLFIVIADDDKLISPNSSARLYMAWHSAGHPAELHIFIAAITASA